MRVDVFPSSIASVLFLLLPNHCEAAPAVFVLIAMRVCACVCHPRPLCLQHKGFSLEVLDEAFTSEHWIVRIYKVKKPSNTIATPDAPSQHPSKHKKFGQIDTGV